MKSKTLRILVVAICSVVLVAEAFLLTAVLGKNDAARANAADTSEAGGKIYKVKRLIQWTTPDTTATYQYEECGRIVEIIKEGRFRETLPNLSSNYGTYIEHFYYDESGTLVKISHRQNNDEWEEEVPEAHEYLTTDGHGGVDYIWPGAIRWNSFTVRNGMTVVVDLSETEYEQFDEDGRLVEKGYNTDLLPDRCSCFTYDGNTVIRTDYKEDGEVLRVCYFTYDDWGQLISAKTTKNGYNTETATYTYDDDGNLVLEDHWSTSWHGVYQIQYVYDGKGNLLKSVRVEGATGETREEIRTYEEFFVPEEYLTDDERKSLGLTYREEWVTERKPLMDLESWNLTDDLQIIYGSVTKLIDYSMDRFHY